MVQIQMSTRRDNPNLQLVGVDGSGMSSEVIVYLRFVGNLLVAYWAFCHGGGKLNGQVGNISGT